MRLEGELPWFGERDAESACAEAVCEELENCAVVEFAIAVVLRESEDRLVTCALVYDPDTLTVLLAFLRQRCSHFSLLA